MIDELGFVPIDQIQNVFTEAMRDIEDDLKRQGVPTDYRLIIEWFDHVRQDLMKKAKHNVSEYVRKNPLVKVKEREEKRIEDAKNTRRQTWDEKVKATRDAAIRDCYHES